ncbi:PadR family transcriptional regulator [Streptosporangium carneum]|uniref:PadR family transcriptional regulator n=1 Tax=Streptosporangium carneum TaxID=47481 RepID=A0A9W6I188_9ACTN|nr:PadR family transcriptional regulator [Streptosporangium carneum]GLK09576.1 PadR family transcriptional regulator [Streptosporangium carneum]
MSLRHAMLGLLSEGPASGYDLLKIFEASLANVWTATQSQLYAELGRLADAGLVEVTAEGPRGRKEYAITEAGLAELRHWLTETDPAPHDRRSEMLLRVFFLGQVRPEQARAYLARLAEDAQRQNDGLNKLKEVVEHGDDALSVYGMIALEWGLRASAMYREWALWAEGQIGDEPGRPRA